jgi:hypothetical protein
MTALPEFIKKCQVDNSDDFYFLKEALAIAWEALGSVSVTSHRSYDKVLAEDALRRIEKLGEE